MDEYINKKCSIFLSVDPEYSNFKRNSEELLLLLNELLKMYTYVYIIDSVDFYNDFLKETSFNIKKRETNTVKDKTNRLYYIQKINPCILHYSIRFRLLSLHNNEMSKERKFNIHIDYFDYRQMNNAVVNIILNRDSIKAILQNLNNYKQKFFENCTDKTSKSFIVFDLDDTLIDKNYKLMTYNIIEILEKMKKLVDYMVLWSHGNCPHVSHAFDQVNIKNYFNLVLCKGKFTENCMNKGQGLVFKELNKKYKICSIKFSILVDDLNSNSIGDYVYFVKIPLIKNEKVRTEKYKVLFKKLEDDIKKTYKIKNI